jgi:hypothetical protein
MDVHDVKGYGEIPAHVDWRNFAARGSVRQRYEAEMPIDDNYDVLDAIDVVWADNVNTVCAGDFPAKWMYRADHGRGASPGGVPQARDRGRRIAARGTGLRVGAQSDLGCADTYDGNVPAQSAR